MKILKYKKDKKNTYKVYLEDDEIPLYDDVIIKFNLLNKKDITAEMLDDILKYNEQLDSYYISIKYIDKKLRSKKEMIDYLKKKGKDDYIINNTISKLESTGYINDEVFIKAFINDKINLSYHGINRIKKELVKLGFSIEMCDQELSKVDKSIWESRIKTYVDKKIRCNHNDSKYTLLIKLKRDLINLGYDREDIDSLLNRVEINDREALKKTYLKVKNNLQSKYEGYELNNKIKAKLYTKGFYINDLKELEDEE